MVACPEQGHQVIVPALSSGWGAGVQIAPNKAPLCSSPMGFYLDSIFH